MSLSFTIDELCKYPFLNAARDWVQEQDIAPLDAMYKHVGIIDRLRTVFKESLENKERTGAFDKGSEESILFYPWLRIFLSLLGVPRVVYKVANLVSKHFSAELHKENINLLQRICMDQGFWVERLPGEDVKKIRSVRLDFRIKLVDYLPIAVLFKSPAWKLVNRSVDAGYVYLKDVDIARIIEEIIKARIIETIDIRFDEDFKKSIMEDPLVSGLFEELKELIQENLKNLPQGDDWDRGGPVDRGAFPPCIVEILGKNAQGKNLVHTERLLMTYFLLTIGQTVEEVLELFKNSPDYNEKIARYQVEFAAGLHGKRTKYKPHNCDTLQSLSLCMKDDPRYPGNFCARTPYPPKNPLNVYRYLSRKQSRSQDEVPGKKVDNDRGDGVERNEDEAS